VSAENIQRLLLVFGLIVTGALLVQAWTADYGGEQAARQLEASQAQPQLAPLDVPAPSVPSAAESPVAAPGGDVPVVSAVAEAPQAPAETATPQAQDRLVEIASDTLHLWVDLVGGDVVKASLLRFPVELDRPEAPLTLLNQTEDFIFIAQSGLTGTDGPDAGSVRPRYRVADLTEGPDGIELALRHDAANGLVVTKRFTLRPGDHLVDVVYDVGNTGSDARVLALFAQLKSDGRRPDGEPGFTMGPRPYWGGAYTTPDSRYEKVDFSDLDSTTFEATEEGGWVALMQHYFLAAWVGDEAARHRFYGTRSRDGFYRFGFTGPAVRVEPGTTTRIAAQLYVGPKDQNRLREIAENLNLTVDYGFLWWIASPLFQVLNAFHGATGNWGVAIVLLTLVVKLLLYPLSAAGYRSMANMRRVAPDMKRLQERHGDDRQKLSQEMMELYRREKINPLGGCFPILVQMPVFLALYWVLYESVELRHAPLGLWIEDLAAMDPYLVLPLLMGGSMYLQQLLSPPPPDPTQARIMKIMPVMFTFLFLFFPAGLVLYWLVNNVLSVAQQWFITRQVEAAGGKAGA
jgi:YidC/Oxa1 family membrane protein insertase